MKKETEIPKEFSGGCACRKIRYSCTSAPVKMVNCHCRDCQRAGGASHSPTVIVKRNNFIITSGEPKLYECIGDSVNTAIRAFCNSCGSPLFAYSSARPEYRGIRAGSLDDPNWFKPNSDVWTESAVPWV